MKIHINNGCDKLKSCLLCYPANYRITNKSNKKTQTEIASA